MGDVDGVHSWRTIPFVAEDQVYPVLEVILRPTRFQCLSVDRNEQPSVSVTPRRQLDVIHRFTCIRRQNMFQLKHAGLEHCWIVLLDSSRRFSLDTVCLINFIDQSHNCSEFIRLKRVLRRTRRRWWTHHLCKCLPAQRLVPTLIELNHLKIK